MNNSWLCIFNILASWCLCEILAFSIWIIISCKYFTQYWQNCQDCRTEKNLWHLHFSAPSAFDGSVRFFRSRLNPDPDYVWSFTVTNSSSLLTKKWVLVFILKVIEIISFIPSGENNTPMGRRGTLAFLAWGIENLKSKGKTLSNSQNLPREI